LAEAQRLCALQFHKFSPAQVRLFSIETLDIILSHGSLQITSVLGVTALDDFSDAIGDDVSVVTPDIWRAVLNRTRIVGKDRDRDRGPGYQTRYIRLNIITITRFIHIRLFHG
jgi:hypothetical protein